MGRSARKRQSPASSSLNLWNDQKRKVREVASYGASSIRGAQKAPENQRAIYEGMAQQLQEGKAL